MEAYPIEERKSLCLVLLIKMKTLKNNKKIKSLKNLWLTNLSLNGSRGGRFMISASACSYASEIAGT
jgi:hypothetical protein